MSRIVWLILPTFNELANIERASTAAARELERVAPGSFRVLIVDDSSPDGTGEVADRLAAASNGTIEVLHRPHREGLGPAYLAGFTRALAAGADLVLEMDADMSHDPTDIGRLVAAIDEGADLALGSRYTRGGAVADWGRLRRLVSRGGCLYARLLLDLPIRDLTGGFKCFRREVLEAIDLPTVRALGYVFQVELTLRAVRHGFRVVEVPITFHDRQHGRSKMSARIAVEAAWLLPQLRARR
ncbi:MAG TPA: polyprenol monophosphomannose synthase [Solirubrobacteraceae bacterium]|jgi:dolichol-phosphate mannosyltransferase|nr:polyprenol monophosphomannose synthase [Solirubrobacteraceae bacterium]